MISLISGCPTRCKTDLWSQWVPKPVPHDGLCLPYLWPVYCSTSRSSATHWDSAPPQWQGSHPRISWFSFFDWFIFQLLAAEGRISRLEECDCRKSCVVNETEHQDGAYWQIGCDMCRCRVSEMVNNPKCHKLTFILFDSKVKLVASQSSVRKRIANSQWWNLGSAVQLV